MRIATRLSLVLLLFLFLGAPAQAEDESNLPPDLEKALTEILEAAPQGKAAPSQAALDTVIAFVSSNTKPAKRILPAKRPQGYGAYLNEQLNIPLKKLIQYTLNPAVPGESLYPNSVRRNAWLPNSPLLREADSFTGASLPPASTLVTRGTEFEEITPDTSSLCYYMYTLDRLFVLTSYKGRSALFSVSLMPQNSGVGLKGAIVGKDTDWTYVYSGVQGTNLAFLGWAETYMYGSASVSVFLDNGANTNLYMFKWAKAGWNGANVVKPSHIREGLNRFLVGLRQVLENPRCPAPDAIAAQFKTLSGQTDQQLRAQLQNFSAFLAQQKSSPLDEKEYRKVLDNNAYAASLSRDNVIAELMKLYMRGQLGTLPQALR